jgi:hypothetical protein
MHILVRLVKIRDNYQSSLIPYSSTIYIQILISLGSTTAPLAVLLPLLKELPDEIFEDDLFEKLTLYLLNRR